MQGTSRYLLGAVAAACLLTACSEHAVPTEVPPSATVLGAAVGESGLVRLNDLIDGGTLVAGDVQFSNFATPSSPPANVTNAFGVNAPVDEFGDVAVSAAAGADGTVSLSFVIIDPATGQPSPLVVGGAEGAEKIRDITYTVTVTDPSLRIHSIDQTLDGVTVTGNSMAENGLFALEPAGPWSLLIFDQSDGTGPMLRGATMPAADGSGTFSASGGILLPGGNLTTYNIGTAFGFNHGNFGAPAGGSLNGVTLTFSLVPAGSPVPQVVPNLATRADGFAADGLFLNSAGFGSVLLTDFAQEGGAVVALTSSNPAAQTVPDSVVVPQGYRTGAFQLPPATVDAPTTVTVTASYNGRTVSLPYTAVPATPLTITGVGPFVSPQPASGGAILRVLLNRQTFAPATVQVSSSSPLATAPATVTVPAFSDFVDFDVRFDPVNIDTPVTISATFNGTTVTSTLTIKAPTEVVRITKAEYVVKKQQLRVEATSTNPAATSLVLSNAQTGETIGPMTFEGASGGGAKFSFQGTVPQVFVLKATSPSGASASVSVSQK
ncbi:MAG TPA: hypothetical protein VFK13_08715 [Gemmatimonadaceae bacterium]|nr:hypothetical protein [Gemmatimonadaceae bacterium]